MSDLDRSTPRRRWRVWHFILIGVIGLAAFIGILLTTVMALTRPVVDGSDSFMAALRDSDFDRAYALAAPDLQRELGGAKAMEARIGPYRPVSWSWSSRSIRNGVGRVSGGATYAGGRAGTAEIELHKAGDAWRVTAFRLN